MPVETLNSKIKVLVLKGKLISYGSLSTNSYFYFKKITTKEIASNKLLTFVQALLNL